MGRVQGYGRGWGGGVQRKKGPHVDKRGCPALKRAKIALNTPKRKDKHFLFAQLDIDRN